MLSVRPKVTELAFQLYGRALHPELFDTFLSRTLQRESYSARIDITGAGHVISWRVGGMTLTEVATSSQNPLPQRRRLMYYKLRGERNGSVDCRGGIVYQMSFQVETAAPEIFWSFQQELVERGAKSGLLCTFDSGNRLHLGAVSFLQVETKSCSLEVQSFHTFPDDFVIVKTQSCFELPSPG